ncbi:MAG: TerC family protein [Elusimicrobia bacterium]|nr:TerC family protein [Elusimicrobiota bacterium]
MVNQTLLWIIFAVVIVEMLLLDLGVFTKKAHEISLKESLKLSVFWVLVALLFNIGIYFLLGMETALKFFAGYLIERSLSVDNLFVFLIIFSYFKVPSKYQHKVLFYGIIGALIIRGIFIFAGIAIIQRFSWAIYLFGVFLIYTGIKMFSKEKKEMHPEKNIILKVFRKLFNTTENYEEDKFFIKRAGKYIATPLLIVVIVIETTDIVFAVDSIPAVLGITNNPFIVYTSNIFAVLGLRALFFALAGIMKMFYFLSYGLSAILIFIGVKMLVSDFYKIPIGIALGVVTAILSFSIIISILKTNERR